MTQQEHLRNLQKQFVHLGEKYLTELKEGSSTQLLQELAAQLAKLSKQIEALQLELNEDTGNISG